MNRIKTFSNSKNIVETTFSAISMTHSIEDELDFADKYAEEHLRRYSHKEIFTHIKDRIKNTSSS